MIYLTAPEAAALATDLAAQSSLYRWAFDLASPMLLTMIQQEMGSHMKEAHIEFKFAPEEGEAFFEAHGWKWITSNSMLKTAATLNRLTDELKSFAASPEPPGPPRNFPWSGVCLFERNAWKG